MEKCKYCNFETDNKKILANHIRWKHKIKKGSKKYYDYIAKVQKKKTIEKKEYEIICKECKTKFTIKATEQEYKNERYRHFCSTYCSHKQGSKKVDYSKVSKWAKEHKVGFLSPDYISKGGIGKHSKREIEIVKYFKENFLEDEWKQGFIEGQGGKKFNGCYINPDLHSSKLKIVIEYDGIWHFKNINGQLKRKQRTDRAVYKWCINNGYRIIRIDESLNLQISEIEKAVYHSSKKIEIFNSDNYKYLFK